MKVAEQMGPRRGELWLARAPLAAHEKQPPQVHSITGWLPALAAA